MRHHHCVTSTGVPKPPTAPKQAPPPPAPDQLDKLTQARLLALAAPVTLPADPAELTADHVPRPQTVLEQLLSASRMRASIADNKPVHTCRACCGMCTGLASLEHQHLPLEELPNLALLRADEPATPELPRHGLTHVVHEGVKYCITPDGISSAQGEPVAVRVCKQCHDDLARKKVPKFGYPRVDTGPWPKDECGALPELTYVESLLRPGAAAQAAQEVRRTRLALAQLIRQRCRSRTCDPTCDPTFALRCCCCDAVAVVTLLPLVQSTMNRT